MPGRNGADNKFGLSPFIVGVVEGDGCNYSSIQTAINDCSAAGGGVVNIRPGTYTENLTFLGGVELVGNAADGRLPTNPPLSKVIIQGEHSFSPSSGGFEIVICENISFVDPAFGDLFTLNPTAATFCIFALKYSGGTSNSGAGAGRVFVINPDVTSFCLVVGEQANIDAGSTTFDMIGAGAQQIQMFHASASSNSANCINMASGTCAVQITMSNVFGNLNSIEDLTGTGQIALLWSELDATVSSIAFTTPGGSCTSNHSTFNANGADYISGTGTFAHADSSIGSTTTLAVTVTENPINWQPYARSAAAAAGSFRGTSSFDSVFFTVTDGWVTFTGTVGSFAWIDQAANTVVNSNEGNFATVNGLTLVLPPAPAQGDTCKFKMTTAGSMIVQANAGQTLQVANQPGTNATSTLSGDALELTFQTSTSTWWADSVVGIWNIT